MANVFDTAVSGLIAFQNALAVTSNNVANATTPGYSRQLAGLTERTPDATAGAYIGNGVDLTGVSRAYDQFAVNQLRNGTGVLSQQTAFVNIANQVDSLVGGSTNGVSSAITNFFNAWHTLASNPTSVASRQNVISQAQGLANSLSQTASQLNALNANANSQIQSTVGTINTLAASIAKLNQTIAVATGATSGASPNDLLDQRDQLLAQLSALTTVKTNTESNGAVDVFIGNGQPLVIGTQTTPLATVPNSYDATKLDISYGGGASKQVITSSMTGGQLGGLLQVSSQLIQPTLNALGQVATGIAVLVNSQQARGFNQNAQLGQPIFTVASPQALGAATNTGNATLTAGALTSATIGKLTTNNYVLRFQSGAWTAQIAGSGQAVTLTGAGTAANPLVVDGLSLVVAGAPANGDTFLVEPTATASTSLSVVLTDPAGIAAANPLQSAAALTNASNATLGGPQVPLITDPSLLMPATINFLSPTTYTLTTQTAPATFVTSAVQALAAGGVITAPAVAGVAGSGGGWTVTLTGTAAVGDKFTVSPNTTGSGDNTNALAMAGLQSRTALAGGTLGLGAAYANLVNRVGTATQQATQAQSAQQSLVAQATQTVQNISGVNIDEEAANMLRWQEAYAATAKLVATADSMFQTLIHAFGGG